jgi:hypothetical protein
MSTLSSCLKFRGYQVRCLNLCFAEDTEEALRQDFADFKPQTIGF